MDDGPALRLRAVSVELGGRKALEDVDLLVNPGQLVGMVGPNGAGKTTVIRTALGLVTNHCGHVELLNGSPAQRRSAVGYVPQRHEFAWHFPTTVAKAVMSGRVHRIGWFRRATGRDRELVDDALRHVGLQQLADRPIGELSGGQRQRVLVARALALQPKLLLLDEPFTGVDTATLSTLTRLLSALRDQGVAMLMASHDVAAVTRTCDRVVLLNRRVVKIAAPAELDEPALWLRTFGVAHSDDVLWGAEGAYD